MPLRFTPLVLLSLALLGPAQALAQGVPPHGRKRAVIDKACARDLAQYCPDLADTGQLRNQLICLRPYRIDLTLPCHRAVTAASP